jgi:hypothetical protein
VSLLRAMFAAAFAGFATLLAIVALLIGGEAAEAKDPATRRLAVSPDDPDRVATAVRLATADRSSEQRGVLYGMALLGAIVAASTTLLLRAFAAGRKTTALLGLLLGPLLPVAIFAPQMLREGKAEDLAGLTVLAAIAGLVAGILEAGRRPPTASAGWGRTGGSVVDLEIGAGNRT